MLGSYLKPHSSQFVQSVMKAPYRYRVQVSDTTMITIAASLFGQQEL